VHRSRRPLAGTTPTPRRGCWAAQWSSAHVRSASDTVGRIGHLNGGNLHSGNGNRETCSSVRAAGCLHRAWRAKRPADSVKDRDLLLKGHLLEHQVGPRIGREGLIRPCVVRGRRYSRHLARGQRSCRKNSRKQGLKHARPQIQFFDHLKFSSSASLRCTGVPEPVRGIGFAYLGAQLSRNQSQLVNSGAALDLLGGGVAGQDD
jgi:hypothetical protein